MYQSQLSPLNITAVSNRILPEIEQWQTRPLEEVYPIVWLDTIHYKVRGDNAIKSKVVYCLVGVNRDGDKDLYVHRTERKRLLLANRI